jgi:ABC-type multidrug transport system fused ATPase/permease subunit
MNGTIKENITVFASADQGYYESVVVACALHDDLAQLPDGDQSKVGSKGITLSGGQKQRVVRRQTPIYIKFPAYSTPHLTEPS